MFCSLTLVQLLNAKQDGVQEYVQLGAACELFLRYVTRTSNDDGKTLDQMEFKRSLIRRGDGFKDQSIRSKLKAADSKEWIIASLFCGPLVWLFWSLRWRHNKISPDGAVEDKELEEGQKSLFSTKFASASINNSCALDGCVGLANRVLDIDPDDFEMRSPIDGLDKQPLLSFKAITEADAFVMKLPSAAKFAQIASKAGRQKLRKLGPEAHGLTADEIAMIY